MNDVNFDSKLPDLNRSVAVEGNGFKFSYKEPETYNLIVKKPKRGFKQVMKNTLSKDREETR